MHKVIGIWHTVYIIDASDNIFLHTFGF